MCNYLTSSTFFNFQNVCSGWFPKFKSGTLQEIFLMKNLLREKKNGHIVIWLLIIENVYVLIWASYSSHKMCMKEENNREETI